MRFARNRGAARSISLTMMPVLRSINFTPQASLKYQDGPVPSGEEFLLSVRAKWKIVGEVTNIQWKLRYWREVEDSWMQYDNVFLRKPGGLAKTCLLNGCVCAERKFARFRYNRRWRCFDRPTVLSLSLSLSKITHVFIDIEGISNGCKRKRNIVIIAILSIFSLDKRIFIRISSPDIANSIATRKIV